MCGLTGWLGRASLPDAAVIRRMTDCLIHRGPDASGIVEAGPIVLGHRRLSVIDVSDASNQPMFDSERTAVIAYNGEIYNFQDIRRELEREGVRFRTKGDTEVILEAYKQWGVDCLQRFNGMFAFALWDLKTRTLFLARDRLGEKPLFIAELRNGDLVFASEPKALRLHPGVDTKIDPIALSHYLGLNYTVGERSLMHGVKRLAPGHYLLAGIDRPTTIHPYWNLAEHFKHKRRFPSETAAAEELLGLLDDAVRLRLVSDVPLGAFLSGGIDSSAIVASMKEAVGPQRVRTFSIGFNDRSFDEVDEARAAASYFGVHHSEQAAVAEQESTLRALISAADEPLADSSVIPTFYLAKFARQHVTVALSGDGGDECFAGYETYAADRIHQFARWVPAPLGSFARYAVDALLPVSFSKVSFDYKLRQFLAGLHLDAPRAHFSWRTIFKDEERRELCQPDWLAAVAKDEEGDPFSLFKRHFDDVKDCHYIDQGSYVDMKTWLVDDILVKVDRATMAHSLESRAPFLDHRVVEFAAALPVDLKLRGLRKKYLLKLSQRRRLPDWVLRRRKQGFNAPVSKWLAGPLRSLARDCLNSAGMREWFRPVVIERLWQEQDRGQRDNGLKLFGLLCFSLWLTRH